MISNGDALAKLAQRRIVQPIPKFRLAQEHNLEELAFFCLQIGQQPNLFEEFIGEILGLVDNQDRLPSLLDLAEEEQIQFLESLPPVQTADVQTELPSDGVH